MRKKINSEYVFFKIVNEQRLTLTCYINYEKKTYDLMQDHQEGILFRHNNTEININMGYIELAKEALEFVQEKLYNLAKPKYV